MSAPQVTVSIVSHRQNFLVNELLASFDRVCRSAARFVLTQNVADPQPLGAPAAGPAKILINERPKGFGANHNAAFLHCDTPYFCVLNPDVKLLSDPFPPLMATLTEHRGGVVGPLVRAPGGGVEDSARRFPTLPFLARKVFRRAVRPDYATTGGPSGVDWIGGMFMLFPSEVFRSIGGFDEAYFLYYEDVDLCRRLGRAGWPVLYDPRVAVQHDARRASRKSPRLALHHISSIARFLSRR